MEPATLALIGLLAIDAGQTLDISRECRKPRRKYHEGNVILGECPTKGDVLGYFSVVGIGVVIADRYLPSNYNGIPVRSIYRWTVGGLQTTSIGKNISYGIGFNF